MFIYLWPYYSDKLNLVYKQVYLEKIYSLAAAKNLYEQVKCSACASVCVCGCVCVCVCVFE